MIERKIVIGLITSTEYLQQLKGVWDDSLLEAPAARTIARWVWEYFDEFSKAPMHQIEDIFYDKVREKKVVKDLAEEIEEDILPSLSEEFERDSFNLNALLKRTHKYFRERRLEMITERVEGLLGKGEIEKAEKLVLDFTPEKESVGDDVDLSSETALSKVDKAFTITKDYLIEYPKQLGEFWNGQLVRGRLVALLAPEKRGKTFWLLDMGMRAVRQGRNVAFFQAGDMTEEDMLKRICVYLAKKSDIEEYCEPHWSPVRDCVFNQIDTCTKPERECDFGVFPGRTEQQVLENPNLKELIRAYEDNPDYKPCHNCREYSSRKHRWGTVWLEKIDKRRPLDVLEARTKFERFFIRNHRKFRLDTYANGTLSIRQIKAKLGIWEKQDGFIPDIVIIDYADLLEAEVRMDFRHQQNVIWKGLRSLSQEESCLVVTATQSDASSYDETTLKLKNFSEDKRKYAHVTAMYGLNQDPDDREKALGIMRLNEIVIREGAFSRNNEVKVLQDLRRGRPFLGSYW